MQMKLFIGAMLAVALTATAVLAKVNFEQYGTSEEREQAISEAIAEVKAEFAAKEEAKKNRVMTQAEKEGKFTSTQLLARSFKKPSKETLALGQAQLRYEDMVKKAERKLSEIRRKSQFASSQSLAVKAEALADELFHKPGSLLKSEEIAKMWQESGCQELREEINCLAIPTVFRFRTIDGTCNNLQKPLLGASSTPFARLIAGIYEDGISSLLGRIQQLESFLKIGPFIGPYPSARLISTSIVTNRTEDEMPFTHILMQWGQFLDHDLDLGPELEEECEGCHRTDICEPIPVPDLDPVFGNGTPNNASCLPFRRSLPICPTDKPLSFSEREQANDLTSFIDGSMVYGSNEFVGNMVRAFDRGLLRTGPPIPAGGKETLPIDENRVVACPNQMGCFLCGDIRCNEQISLTIMHTIWLREHNRCARELANINPFWGDERLYQECRRIVGALIQKITYVDYLPKVLGVDGFELFVGPYLGFNPDVDPSVPNSFATAAYRYGHSLIRPAFDRLDAGYKPLVIGSLPLVDAFFNPDQLRISLGTDPILRGLVSVNARRVDEFLNTVLTNQLFKNNFAVGMDLAALNIQRSRDHGLPPYIRWVNFCKEIFKKVSDFENTLTLVNFLNTYGSLETVDLWVGGLAENRLPGSLLGATFSCIFGITFARVRDGDRFYYNNPGVFTPEQLTEIQSHTLSRVLCDNGDNINSIQPDAFLSNQTRVSCSQIPGIDFKVFREEPCFIRSRVPSRNFQAEIRIFSRSISSQFLFSNSIVRPSTRAEFVCTQVECPISAVPTTVVVYSNDFRVAANSNLPASSSSNTRFYLANWTNAQYNTGSQLGLFRSQSACEQSSVSTEVAMRFRDKAAAAGATDAMSQLKSLEKALAAQSDDDSDDDDTDEDGGGNGGMDNDGDKTEDIFNIIKQPNPSIKLQSLGKTSTSSKKDEKSLSDDKLLSELESVLKNLQ